MNKLKNIYNVLLGISIILFSFFPQNVMSIENMEKILFHLNAINEGKTIDLFYKLEPLISKPLLWADAVPNIL